MSPEEQAALDAAQSDSHGEDLADPNAKLTGKALKFLVDRIYPSSDAVSDSEGTPGSDDGKYEDALSEMTNTEVEDYEFDRRTITQGALKVRLSKAWQEEFSDKLEDYLSETAEVLDPAQVLTLPDAEELIELAKKVDAQLADDEEVKEWQAFVAKEKARRLLTVEDQIQEEIKAMDEEELKKLAEEYKDAPDMDDEGALVGEGEGEPAGTEEECEAWNEEL